MFRPWLQISRSLGRIRRRRKPVAPLQTTRRYRSTRYLVGGLYTPPPIPGGFRVDSGLKTGIRPEFPESRFFFFGGSIPGTIFTTGIPGIRRNSEINKKSGHRI